MNQKIYTIPEVAKILHISISTVRRHIGSGKIRAYLEGVWKIPAEELERQLFIRRAMTLGMTFKAASRLGDEIKIAEDERKQKEAEAIRTSYISALMDMMHDTNKGSDKNDKLQN